MTFPPCPQCAWPLRWFPEHHGWGCDTCRQMFPPSPMPGASAPRPRRRAAAVLAGTVVAIGAVTAIAVAASTSSEHEGPSAGAPLGDSPASQLPPAIDAAPEIPSTGIAACDAVAALVPKVEACAAIAAGTKKDLLAMAENNLSAVRGRSVPPSYAEYVRPKCAGTASFLSDQLQDAGCAPRQRAKARGFSVPVPSGWQVLQVRGQLPNEVILEERLPALGRTTRAGIYIELVPYSARSDATAGDGDCRALGQRVSRKPGTTLDEVGVVTMRSGRACRNLVHDREERRLGFSMNVQGKYTAGATCTYELGAQTAPRGCLEIIDGLTLE